jgi:CHASE3 domain sensor protein
MTSRRTDALFKAAASLALLITIGLGVFMIRTNNAERDTAAWVVHTLEVTAQISKTQASTTNETNARRGYLLFGDEFFANEMEKAAAEAQQHLIQLNRLRKVTTVTHRLSP